MEIEEVTVVVVVVVVVVGGRIFLIKSHKDSFYAADHIKYMYYPNVVNLVYLMIANLFSNYNKFDLFWYKWDYTIKLEKKGMTNSLLSWRDLNCHGVAVNVLSSRLFSYISPNTLYVVLPQNSSKPVKRGHCESVWKSIFHRSCRSARGEYRVVSDQYALSRRHLFQKKILKSILVHRWWFKKQK